jgi:hypothetical protein
VTGLMVIALSAPRERCPVYGPMAGCRDVPGNRRHFLDRPRRAAHNPSEEFMDKTVFDQRFALFQNGDVHLMSGPIADPRQASRSAAIDAADDRKWLAEHPLAEYRVRPASYRELAATGMPRGSEVITIRGPYGSQLRAMLYPKGYRK